MMASDDDDDGLPVASDDAFVAIQIDPPAATQGGANYEEDEEGPSFGSLPEADDDGSVFEGYSSQEEEEEEEEDAGPNFSFDDSNNNANENEATTGDEESADNNSDGWQRIFTNGQVDLELGIAVADLENSNNHHREEEEDEEEGSTSSDDDINDRIQESQPEDDGNGGEERNRTCRSRTWQYTRFLLHIVLFPVLVITSVAIPVLIVMFCFALMFVALVVLLCVYYCCSPRRGDQAAVPFHVLIRQILEAVEDETHGLGDNSAEAPKLSREEIQNSLVRRRLVDFECTDETDQIVEDQVQMDEATREERMHQDMFPVMMLTDDPDADVTGPCPATKSTTDEDDTNGSDSKPAAEARGGAFRGIRKRFQGAKRKGKSSKKNVSVVDHNNTYELRLSQRKLAFKTDPSINQSKHFLLKRTFVFSPPLGPEKVDPKQTSADDSNDLNSVDDDILDILARTPAAGGNTINLAAAAMEEDDSSSSGFFPMLPLSSSSSSSSSSESSSDDEEAQQQQERRDDPSSSDESFLLDDNNNEMDLVEEARGATEAGGHDNSTHSNNSNPLDDDDDDDDNEIHGDDAATAPTIDKLSTGEPEVDMDAALGVRGDVAKDPATMDNRNKSANDAVDPEVGNPVLEARSQSPEPNKIENSHGGKAMPSKDDSEENGSISETRQVKRDEFENRHAPDPAAESEFDVVSFNGVFGHKDALDPAVELDCDVVSFNGPLADDELHDKLPLDFAALEEAKTEITSDDSLVDTVPQPPMDTIAGDDVAAITAPIVISKEEITNPLQPPTTPSEHRGISSYCNICLLEYEVGDIVVWSRRPHGCHHAWHEDCLIDWLHRKPTCPSCRQEYFAVEDAQQQLQDSSSSAEANDNNSPGEENHTILPESTHSIPIESGHSARFLW